MKFYAAYYALVALGAATYVLAPRVLPRAWQRWSVLAVPAVLVAGFLWRYSEPPRFLNDFKKAYYPAAELVRDRGSLTALYDANDPASGFVNIPIVAWAFVPLTALGDHAAGIAFTVVGVVAVAAACFWLVRLTGAAGWAVALVAGLFVINGPLYNSLREGNTTHLLLLAVVGALWALHRNHDVLAGVLIGVVVVAKPPLVLLAGPLLLRQRWAGLAGAGASVACIGGLSLLVYGWDIHRTWYDVAVEPFSGRPLGAFNAQSLDGAMARLISGDEYYYDWTPITEYGNGFRALSTVLRAALLAVPLFVWWRTRGDSSPVALNQELSVALLLALIISPASWAHYYLLLLVPLTLAVTLNLGIPDDRRWWAVLVVAVLLVAAPVRVVSTSAPVLDVLVHHVGSSYLFIGGVILLALLVAARWRSATAGEPVTAPALAISSD